MSGASPVSYRTFSPALNTPRAALRFSSRVFSLLKGIENGLIYVPCGLSRDNTVENSLTGHQRGEEWKERNDYCKNGCLEYIEIIPFSPILCYIQPNPHDSYCRDIRVCQYFYVLQ